MKNKTKKIIFGALGAIIIGAIGSGVWEKLLGPLISSSVSGLATLFSSISKSYANSLYSDIGKGSSAILGHFIMVPYLMVLLFLIIYPFVLSYRLQQQISRLRLVEKEVQKIDPEEKNVSQKPVEKSQDIIKRIKTFVFINYVVLFSIAIIVLSRITKDSYAYDVITYIEQSIDILSPYISENKLKELKSEYRQIDSRKKFQELNAKFKAIADSNQIMLPSISALKIE